MALSIGPSPFYFGYGSNMWKAQMVDRCSKSEFQGIGRLKDWKWIISKNGYANIIQSPGDIVYGLVYKLSEGEEESLDEDEDVPNDYFKAHGPVTFLGTKDLPEETERRALLYIDLRRRTEGEPKEEYIHRMNKAIADALSEGVPGDYVEKYLRPFIRPDTGV